MTDAERSQRAYARLAGPVDLVVLAASVAGLVLSARVIEAGPRTFGAASSRRAVGPTTQGPASSVADRATGAP